MFSPLTPADKGFTPRTYSQLLQDFLRLSEAGAPGAPSVSEVKSRDRFWRTMGKQTANGSKYTAKF